MAAMFVLGIIASAAGQPVYFNGRAGFGEDAANKKVYEIIGNADSFTVLMWAAFGGSLVAGILSFTRKLLSLEETVDAYLNGIKSMVLAIVILLLAWSLGSITADLSTADYVLHITRGLFSPHLLPVMTFITAALI